MPGFSSYQGHASMYQVHKFMDLDASEVGYFITQVGLAAASFGVAPADVTAVGHALAGLFDVRCAPPTTVIMAQGPQLQSICIADDCPVAPNATCSGVPEPVEPFVANPALADGEGDSSSTASMAPTGVASNAPPSSTATATGSATAAATSAVATGAAARVAGGVVAGAAALAAFLL